MEKIGIAIVGFGYWGPNLARNFYSRSEFALKYIIEADASKRQMAKERYPDVIITENYDAALKDNAVDAIAIATPTATHFKLAKQALESGKHVLVEKPVTDSSEKAKMLAAIASSKNLTVMVDHTYIYTPAVQIIKTQIQRGELGELYYYDSTRVNLGLFQNDVDVLWDLAVHDLSILMYLRDEKPLKVSANGIAHISGHPINMANINLYYKSNFMAHINVNWLSPIKIRQMLIGGDKKMVVYNDLEATEKVKIYNNGLLLNTDNQATFEKKIGYRLGDLHAPFVAPKEALNDMVAHFADCIISKKTPLTNLQMATDIVTILEATKQSICNNGSTVDLTE